MEYDRHYDLQSVLAQDSALIPSPKLYDYDDEAIYAALIDRLAQNLPDGSPSPFSAQNPGTMTASLVSVMVYLQSLIGHEINLIPDRAWVHLFRMMGIEFLQPEYPVIGLVFARSPQAISLGLDVEVPMGVEVRSSVDLSLSAITLTPAVFTGSSSTITVPARLNRLGVLPQIRPGEFSILPQLLSFIESVSNPGAVSSRGRQYESLPEAMLRARYQMKTQKRCVTARDYYFWAKELGATQVNVIPKLQRGVDGNFNDLITVAIYPQTLASPISPQLQSMSLADIRLSVIPANIIPIDGDVTVRATLDVSDFDLRNRLAVQIMNEINPPNGKWGDLNLPVSLATALEHTQGNFATSKMDLRHAVTHAPLSTMKIYPWDLFEIQQTLSVTIDRS